MLTRQLVLFSCSFLLMYSSMSTAAIAADDKESASLDSMWIDQEAPTIDKDATDNTAKASAGTVASAGGVPNTVAPMCSFEEFRNSGFVAKGSWPGLGPFKASGNDISEMTDDRQNHLKLSVNNEQITSAQLGLGKLGSGNVRDFLDIQMTSDFLLESLGAKPRKIAEFNKHLEKNKQALKPGAKGITLVAGRYQVVIDRSKNAQPYSCLIAVNSLDASKSVIAEHAAIETEETAEAKPEVKKPIFDTVKKPFETIKKPAAKPKTQVAAINPTEDPKRDEFVTTIKSWQQIKKTALKKRDPSHLPEILSGIALSKQNTAVKWLQTHGNYYDMDPRGCSVQKYTDLGAGKKYSVLTEVREFSKYIRESDNAVLKEVDDKYLVNYTIEKVNDKWMITDSAVVNNSNQSTAAKQPTKSH